MRLLKVILLFYCFRVIFMFFNSTPANVLFLFYYVTEQTCYIKFLAIKNYGFAKKKKKKKLRPVTLSEGKRESLVGSHSGNCDLISLTAASASGWVWGWLERQQATLWGTALSLQGCCLSGWPPYALQSFSGQTVHLSYFTVSLDFHLIFSKILPSLLIHKITTYRCLNGRQLH